ncbi:MAG: hypothetical protein Q4A84_09450 [Neisseria sp.]|uniref:hypothetical protein n=1 Tax=Neisseria sp. TaxID=192066 RepID=UPI0026DD4283|nr:hypothetical protein [Neisseria sp.]MDO4641903.1 hypothetical protein [Neisseria sp.]
MVLAGFVSPMCLLMGSARDRTILYRFFQELKDYLIRKQVPNHELVSDRLYRRYVRWADLEETNRIMVQVEDDFINENPQEREEYRVFFKGFYECVEEVRYLIEIGRKTNNRFQTGLLDIVESALEKELPNEYYDDLPDNAEPVWMRTEELPLDEICDYYAKK